MFNLIFKDPTGDRLSGPFRIGIRKPLSLRVLELAALMCCALIKSTEVFLLCQAIFALVNTADLI
jgi:hypothetical protein